jgi:hypothetical protein
MEFHVEFMVKKILFGLLNGMLLVSFCYMEKAVGAVSSLPRERENFATEERKVMEKKHSGDQARSKRSKPDKPGKSGRSRSVEPRRKAELPPPPPLPQEETRKVVQVICNKRVLDVYQSPDRCSSDLWQKMLDLTEGIAEEHNWYDSKGARSLVYHLAKIYDKTTDQDKKDVIALYFVNTSGCCVGELAGGDDNDAEQDAIEFVDECLIDEEDDLQKKD